VVLCLGHLGEQVRDFVGDGERFGLRAKYVFDGDKVLGTGGAVRGALEQGAVEEEDFGVIYGDSYLDVEFPPIYQSYLESKKSALMTVLLNENRWDKSNVVMRDGMISVYDKKTVTEEMCHIDYGLLLFSRRFFMRYPANQAFDLSSVLQELVSAGQLAAYEVTQRFYEIGTPSSLAETDLYVRSKLSALAKT
jgi:NDP-sugar pyrophosphorylase family protein